MAGPGVSGEPRMDPEHGMRIMPTSLTALLAAVLHDARAATANADTTGLDHAAALLVTAAGGQAVCVERESGRLLVNGLPVSDVAPGVGLVAKAMQEHGTTMIEFPASLGAAEWAAIGILYASSPSGYQTAEHFRAALEASAPGVVLREETRFDIVMDDRPDRKEDPATAGEQPVSDLTSSIGERADLSTRLDPLIGEGNAAVSRRDWDGLADVVIRMHGLELSDQDGARAILIRECRRVVPEMARAGMARRIAAGSAPAKIMQGMQLLGQDGANALIDAIAADPSRTERRALLDALARFEGIDTLIIESILSPSAALARDMADMAGRRRIEKAVDNLARQLRHAEESVRTAAWHALEEIGTAAAIAAIGRGR